MSTLLPATITPEGKLRDALPAERWEAAMRAICQRHDIAFDAPRPFASGSDVVYAIGENTVVKLTAPQWAFEIESERRCLEGLAGRLRVAVPALKAHGRLDDWAYVVMARVEGEAVGRVWPSLDAPARRRLAQKLGEMTAELHASSVPGLRAPDWESFVRGQREGLRQHHGRCGASAPLLDAAEDLLDAIGDPFAGAASVPLHTELLDEHILVREEHGEWVPGALLDFADAWLGPPDYEVAALVEFIFAGEPGALRAFLLGMGREPATLDAAESRRLFACALLHQFASLPRMLAALDLSESTTELAPVIDGLYDLDA